MEVQPLTAQIDVVIDKQPLIDKINQLEQTIATLTAQKEQLEQNLAAANSQISALNAQIQTLNTQIAQLENEKLQLQNQITQLQNEVATLENQKAALQNQITQLQSQIIALNNQITDLQTQISALQSQITNYENGLDNLNGEVVENKLDYALETKNLIATAINNKGGAITSETTFRQYPNQIAMLLPRKNIKTNVLLHFDNPDNMTEDSSFYSQYNVIGLHGDGELSTTIKKFGRSSFHFTGSNNIYIQGGHGFPYFDGCRFTLEFWYYRDVAFTSNYECFLSNAYSWSTYAVPYGWWFHVNSSYISFVNGGQWTVEASSSSITRNTWHHIAFCRLTDKARIFVDGNMLVEKSIGYQSTSGYATNWGWADVTIGSAQWYGNYLLKGYMDEVRITNGGLYTANFTPPTEPFAP